MSDDIPVEPLIAAVTAGVATHLEARGRRAAIVVGIRTGGVWIADRLRMALGITDELGMLNINFYRDDFTAIGMHPRVGASHLPMAVDDRHLVLVDDVLHTGRTIRAALNEIFDYGRPASVTLAVLVDRGGREIPVQADVTGMRLELRAGEYVKLTGPQPLTLEVRTRD